MARPTNDAEVLVNEFLNLAAANGALSVQHMRCIYRQPETESFVRKTALILQKIAPTMKIEITQGTIAAPKTGAGSFASSRASAEYASKTPALRHLVATGEQDLAPVADLSAAGVSSTATHAVRLRSCIEQLPVLRGVALSEFGELFRRSSAFGNGPVTVAAGVSGPDFTDAVRRAADSVFLQSFADAYAIGLAAHFDGREVALALVDHVLQVRRRGGDFSAFSLAPLSHDTAASLELVRAHLARQSWSHATSRHDVRGHAFELACAGLQIWLRDNNVDDQHAARVISALRNLAQALASRG